MEVLKKKFPKGALSFYIELYCKRKSETENKCTVQQEALKSWISLKKSEKKFFETKYNEYLCNYKKSVAMCLKNAEPYMKSKMLKNDRRNSSQNVGCKNDKIDEEDLQNDLSSSKIEIDDTEDCADHIPDTQNEKNTEIEINNYDHEISDTKTPEPTLHSQNVRSKNDKIGDTEDCADHIPDTQNEKNTELEINNYDHEISDTKTPEPTQDEVISIPEPIAPKIMTGKQLFFIINEREQNNLMWEELTQLQKNRYSKAALIIKKNYLKQYREYLEHLPSEKLFNHYKIMRYSNM